jgi:hypothetical protein
MDLTAELTELSHGLHRQRRLIELTSTGCTLRRWFSSSDPHYPAA